MATLFCGVIVGVVLSIGLSRFFDSYSIYDAMPFEELLEEARQAIHNVDVGGDAVLPTEAASLIRYAKQNATHCIPDDELAECAPNMKKLQDILPQNVQLRIVRERSYIYSSPAVIDIEIPEHVTIRFGTHTSYH
jgi:hypothetical protein